MSAAYVICCNSSQERKAYMLDACKRADITPIFLEGETRVSAHAEAWREIGNANADKALILEDTAVFCKDFHEKYEKYVEELPDNFDIFFIEDGGNRCIPKDYTLSWRHVYLRGTHATEWGGDGPVRGTEAYVISKSCASMFSRTHTTTQNILSNLPMSAWMNTLLRHMKATTYWAEPHLVKHGTSFYNIDSVKIFVIGSKENEPDRITYLEEYFQKENIHATYIQPWYKHTLTPEILQKYAFQNLRKSEISLFLNYIELFERILQEDRNGAFLVLESDVRFKGPLQSYLIELLNELNTTPFHCVSIGSGCGLLIPGKDSASKDVCFMRTQKTRCTDSFLYTYEGIEKVYSYIMKYITGNVISKPFDIFLDDMFKSDTSFQFLWAHPVACIQGSENGIYPTAIQGSD